MLRALLGVLVLASLSCFAALAQSSGVDEGAFEVGPYNATFFATQENAPGERYCRQIPSFGPTALNVEFVGGGEAAPGVDIKDLGVEVQLLWGKNELRPPQLLETRQSRGDAPINFEHSFDEDGKYIISVTAREPGGAEHRGQYIFFVIQTADAHWTVSGLAAAFIVGFVYLIWRQRWRTASQVARRP